MKTAPKHPFETERLKELHHLDLLDTLAEQEYDDITELASRICGTPIALVSLIDQDRQWFKSHHGLEARETHRDFAFCAHAILDKGPLVVPDSLEDPRFNENPLVLGAPNIRFYAGIPLLGNADLPLGTLCVIDEQPRQLTPEQLDSLERLARQIERLFELRRKIAEFKKIERHKDEFISLINHELRTPLTSIYGAISLMSSGNFGELSEKLSSLMKTAKNNSERLLYIINDILEVARLDSEKFNQTPVAFDLVETCSKAIELLNPIAEKNELTFSWKDSPPHVSVYADPQRITQLLQNLLSNAAKYSPTGSEITIQIEVKKTHVRSSIKNLGEGIPISEQHQLFQKFFRSSNSLHRQQRGTGLGLHICKKIAEQSGGTIGFHSIPHSFTEFWFTLPKPKRA